MRFVQNEDEVDYRALALQYSRLIGCLLTKMGTVTLTGEDFELYDFARLRPIEQDMGNGTKRVFLLAEDEWDECARTGRNPRDGD